VFAINHANFMPKKLMFKFNDSENLSEDIAANCAGVLTKISAL